MKPENGGSSSKLSLDQRESLFKHLQNVTYLKVADICAYVKQSYGASFTVSGMTKWFHSHEFSYKKPKGMPAKACIEKQAAAIK